MIEAVGHRLLIRPDKLEEHDPVYKNAKAAGIELPDIESTRLKEMSVDKGTVLQIGHTAFKDFGGDSWVDVGDYIAYARHAGKWIVDPEDNESYLIINDEDVVCRFKTKDSE